MGRFGRQKGSQKAPKSDPKWSQNVIEKRSENKIGFRSILDRKKGESSPESQATQPQSPGRPVKEERLAFYTARRFFITVFGDPEVRLYKEWLLSLRALQIGTSKFWSDEDHGSTLLSLRRTVHFAISELELTIKNKDCTTPSQPQGLSALSCHRTNISKCRDLQRCPHEIGLYGTSWPHQSM